MGGNVPPKRSFFMEAHMRNATSITRFAVAALLAASFSIPLLASSTAAYAVAPGVAGPAGNGGAPGGAPGGSSGAGCGNCSVVLSLDGKPPVHPPVVKVVSKVKAWDNCYLDEPIYDSRGFQIGDMHRQQCKQ